MLFPGLAGNSMTSTYCISVQFSVKLDNKKTYQTLVGQKLIVGYLVGGRGYKAKSRVLQHPGEEKKNVSEPRALAWGESLVLCTPRKTPQIQAGVTFYSSWVFKATYVTDKYRNCSLF